MKRFLTLALGVLVLSFAACQAADQPRYGRYFTDDRLRIDLVFAGNAAEQFVYLDGCVFEKGWSGTRTNLIPPFDYGEYATDVYAADGKLIFSRGFSSLFQEWRTTAEAEKVSRAFTNSAWIPFPKGKVTVAVTARIPETGGHRELLRFEVDPADPAISREAENDFKVVPWMVNGPSDKKVDLCIVAEGYRAEDMEKFHADVERMMTFLFRIEPFLSRRNDFNVWAVESVSQDAGTDIPHQGIWRNTAACSNFYTFGIDRYLTAPDHKAVARLASGAPNDAIYVLVNEEKYGGGGIYNYYALSTADNARTEYVFVHEFGHSFAGLGDEYYESDVAYENMYPAGVEPWEPNITTQAHFDRKWADLIAPGTPVPTPNDSSYIGVVGLFEGGGYSAKGVWRPYFECRMKNNTAPGFCPVCARAINKMIDYYVK